MKLEEFAFSYAGDNDISIVVHDEYDMKRAIFDYANRVEIMSYPPMEMYAWDTDIVDGSVVVIAYVDWVEYED